MCPRANAQPRVAPGLRKAGSKTIRLARRLPCSPGETRDGPSRQGRPRVAPLQLPTTHPVRAEVSKPLVTANQHLFRLSLSKPSPIGVGFRQAQPEQTLVDGKKRFDTSAR